MKTKTVELKNQSTSEVFEIITVSLNKDFIKVADIIEQNDVAYFLELPAGNLVNLLDLTGVTPYEIWYFDEDKRLMGKAFSLHSGQGSFRIQTQAIYILLLKFGTEPSEKFRNFECKDVQLEEK